MQIYDHLSKLNALKSAGANAHLLSDSPYNFIKSLEVYLSLPALTFGACRTRTRETVMNLKTVESKSHLFVFHIGDHLGLSMVGAPTNVYKTRGDLCLFENDLPSTIPKCARSALNSHM